MENLLTVIIQTSPLPSHPSTALLEALFRSFDRVKNLKECNIVILCDGCDDDQTRKTLENTVTNVDEKSTTSDTKTNYKHGTVSQSTANNYQKHLQLLQEKIDKQEDPFVSQQNGSIRLLKLPCRHGSARAIAAAFDILTIGTPYVLIGQHDNFFVKDIHYLQQLIKCMETENTKTWLQCVHFPSTATLNYVQKIQRRYNIDVEKYCKRFPKVDDTSNVSGTFIPLVFWYGRTHLARTSYYAGASCPSSTTTVSILGEFTLKAKDHLEELWGTKQLHEIMELKKRANDDATMVNRFAEIHAKYGNYVFFENGANGEIEQREVLYHLSGRKVVASDESPSDSRAFATIGGNNQETNTFNPQPNSFTQAHRVVAVVPGLKIAPNPATNRDFKAKSRFRQNCFHCGEKGK